MRLLYTESNLLSIRAQIRRRRLVLYAVSALFFALFIITLVIDDHKQNRPQLLTLFSVLLGGGFAIFYYDLMIRPLRCYERHLEHALHGRNHEMALEFLRVEPELSLVDGVRFRGLTFLGDPDKHGVRETGLYWDAELPLPEFVPGQSLTVRYYDRCITGYQ